MNFNKIRVKIFNTFIVSLIGTGCSVTVISENIARKLKIQITPLSPDDTKFLFGANGNRIKLFGKANISVKIGGLAIPYDFSVVQNLTQDLILGHDFLTTTKALINYSDNTITFFDNLIEVQGMDRNRKIVALLNRNFDLQPRTESLVDVRFSENLTGDCFLIEPLMMREKQKYLVARIIAKAQNGKSFCRILNPTNQVIHLKGNKPIAKIQPINESDICPYDDNHSTNNQQINTIHQQNPSNSSPTPQNGHTQNSSQKLFQAPQGNFSQSQLKSQDSQQQNDPAIVQGIFRSLDELGIRLNNENLTVDQKEKLKILLENNSDIFALTLKDLPGTHLVTYDIDTGDALPIKSRPYRHSPEARREINKQIEELLEADFIRPCDGPWASPTVLVKKKDHSVRFCIDYRKLNKISRHTSWNLPLITDVIDSLSESQSQYFSSLDMKSGYHQIFLTPETSEKTAFCVNSGTYRWLRLSFGLQQAGQCFQMLMAELFRNLTFKCLIVYIDDILVFSRTFEDHCRDLQEVFSRLRNANLRLHPAKCSFCKESVKYLGFVLDAKGLKVDDSKIQVIQNWKTPKNLKELRSFLGYCGFYRRFIFQYAKVCNSLYQLLKKDQPFLWTEDCQNAFEKLKHAMCHAPILAWPDLNKTFELQIDASLTGIGYILSQVGEDKISQPIAMGGRSLRANEKNRSITEIEAIGLIEAIRENLGYLQHQHFKIYSDNISLQWINSIKRETGRLFRWSLLLQPLSFEVIHKPGRLNVTADALSRLDHGPAPKEDPQDEFLNEDIQIMQIDAENILNMTEREYDAHLSMHTTEHAFATLKYDKSTPIKQEINLLTEEELFSSNNDIQKSQRDCSELSRIILYLETGELPENDKLARKTIFESETYFMQNDLLFHLYRPRNKNSDQEYHMSEQLALPRSFRNKILQQYHDTNHTNFNKTYSTIRRKYFWTDLYRDTKTFVNSCEFCQRSRIDNHPKRVPLKCWEVGNVWTRVHVDVLGKLPINEEGQQYVLLVICAFSKWAELIPIKSLESKEIAEVLFNEIFLRYGMCKQLVSDSGTSFLSRVVDRLCELCKITRARVLAYHPQTNSACENFNRIVWKSLKAHCQGNNASWAKYLNLITCSHKATVSIYGTNFTPHELFTGRQMELPIDSMIKFSPTTGSTDVHTYMRSLEDRLKTLHDLATQNILANQKVYKKAYDKHAKTVDYAVGTKLWLLSPSQLNKKGLSSKMQIRYNRLITIREKIGETTYLVNDANTGQQLKTAVHADNLRDYTPRDEEDDLQSPPTQTANNDLTVNDPANAHTDDQITPQLNNKPTQDEDLDEDLETNTDVSVSGGGEENSEISSETIKPVNYTQIQNKIEPKIDTKRKVSIRRLPVPVENRRIPTEVLEDKLEKGKRYLLVKWLDPQERARWLLDIDVPKTLKDEFYKDRHPSGRLKRIIKRKN